MDPVRRRGDPGARQHQGRPPGRELLRCLRQGIPRAGSRAHREGHGAGTGGKRSPHHATGLGNAPQMGGPRS